ncbi:MAG: sulfotransferase [Planctomycetota bacterium]
MSAFAAETAGLTAAEPVGVEPQPLPLLVRAPYAVARKCGVGSPRLTPHRLVQAAARKTGLAPKVPTHVEDALEQLCRSLADDARLHWFGAMNQRTLIVTGLAALMQVEQAFRDDPSLHDQELVPPLIVTGLPRSGTTFLHRLLSASQDAASVALYQHVHPVPPRGWDTRRLQTAVMFEPWKRASKAYDLDAIHYVRPGLPDECNFGMRIGARSMIFWAMAPVYGYLRWLLGQDLREAYQLYRKVLQLHQRQAPGRRLTLKCPHHLAWLPALSEALPEALIVQTHRDPAQVVPSECKLILSLQAMSTSALDWRRTVAHNHLKVETFAQRSVDFADTPCGRRVRHVDYRRLVAEPVEIARDIHGHFGLPFSESHADRLTEFASQNRQHKRGRNRYSLEQFGLDKGGVRRAHASYCERFIDG